MCSSDLAATEDDDGEFIFDNLVNDDEAFIPETVLEMVKYTQNEMDQEEKEQYQREKTQFMQDLEQDHDKTWEDVTKKTDPLIYGERFFRNNDDTYYNNLGTACGLKTTGRSASRAGVAKIYMMGAMGATMNDTINPRKTEQCLQAGDELTEFMENHKLRKDMSPQETKEVASEFGEIYHKAAEKIAAETLPNIDFKDPYAVKKNYAKLVNMKVLSIDYIQTKGNLEKVDGFVDAYGGKEKMDHVDERITNYGRFINMVTIAHGIEKNTETEKRVAGMYMINCCGDMVKGRSAMDLTPQETEKLRQVSKESVIVLEWAAQCTPEELVQAEAYINGNGPLPQGAKTMIEEYHKMEEKAKQQEQKEMIEKEKTQKVEQKTEQKPKREKVGLDDLMGEEKSKKSFKKTAESQTVKKYQKENQM